APTSLSVAAGSLQVSINYQLVRLWEMPAQEILALDRDQLLPFVPLMDGGPAELTLTVQRLSQINNQHQRDSLALNLLVLGSLRYNPQTMIEAMRRENMMYGIPIEQLRETPG